MNASQRFSAGEISHLKAIGFNDSQIARLAAVPGSVEHILRMDSQPAIDGEHLLQQVEQQQQ
jgi:hypothetical protein